MIGLDTNILVRYIVQDDPEQSEIATKYIERYVTSASPGYINQIVLCEIVWVLKRAYGYKKDILVNVISRILHTKEFIVEYSESAWLALKEYKKGDADFSDYLIAISNHILDCKYTITFDELAANSRSFKLLK